MLMSRVPQTNLVRVGISVGIVRGEMSDMYSHTAI